MPVKSSGSQHAATQRFAVYQQLAGLTVPKSEPDTADTAAPAKP